MQAVLTVESAERLLETSGHAPSGRAWLVDKDRRDAGLLERRLREALTMIAKCEEDIKYSKSFFYAAKGVVSFFLEGSSFFFESRRWFLHRATSNLGFLIRTGATCAHPQARTRGGAFKHRSGKKQKRDRQHFSPVGKPGCFCARQKTCAKGGIGD